ncbi:MAG: hypothetical protein ACLT16_09685 [[Clostridium] innocuum]
MNRIQFEDIPASGETPLGQAVTFALDRLEERLDTYGDLGIEIRNHGLSSSVMERLLINIRRLRKEQRHGRSR